MFSRVKIVHITFVVLAFGTQGQGTAREPDKAGAVLGSEVVRGDQLTRQQFEALPDTAVIEFKGKRMTKAEIRVKAANSQEAMAKVQAVARQIEAQFEQRRIQIERQQQAKIRADKAKAMAEFTRQSDAGTTPQARQFEAIQKEAAQLYERSKRASPTEQAQIEQRARQLLQQLSQVSPPR
jgi:hypothetical protein